MIPTYSHATQTADSLVFLGKVAEWIKSAPEQDHAGEKGAYYVAFVEVAYSGENDGLGRFYNEDPDWMWEQQNDLTGTCGRPSRPYNGADAAVCNRPRAHHGPHALIADTWT